MSAELRAAAGRCCPGQAVDVQRRTRRAARTGALLSTELLLVLPILVGVFFAIVEFSLLLSANQQVKLASRVACRVGTLPAANPSELQRAVCHAAETALAKPNLIGTYELTFQPGRYTGDRVVVEIRVPMKAASPDLLAAMGLRLGGRKLVARTVMRKE